MPSPATFRESVHVSDSTPSSAQIARSSARVKNCEWDTPVTHVRSSDAVPADERTKGPSSPPRPRKREFSLDSITEECDTDLVYQLHPQEVTDTCPSSPVESPEQAGPFSSQSNTCFQTEMTPSDACQSADVSRCPISHGDGIGPPTRPKLDATQVTPSSSSSDQHSRSSSVSPEWHDASSVQGEPPQTIDSAQVDSRSGHSCAVAPVDHHARSKRLIYEVSPGNLPGTLEESSENAPETSPLEAPSDYEESAVAQISDDPAFLPEFGPTPRDGVITVDDESQTTRTLIHSTQARRSYPCVSLLDSGSPQSFILQAAWDRMVSSGAADPNFVQTTPERRWGGFGDEKLLSTDKRVRLTVQFLHGDKPTAALAVWAYIVPDGTMQHPVLLGRDSWMRFKNRQYRILPCPAGSRPLAELDLVYIPFYGNRSYLPDPQVPSPAERFHLVYAGANAVDVGSGPQILEVNLIRASGAPALIGNYRVDVKPEFSSPPWGPYLVQEGKQYFSIEGMGVIQPGDILGTSSGPLFEFSPDDRYSDEYLSLLEFLAYPYSPEVLNLDTEDDSSSSWSPGELSEDVQRQAFDIMYTRLPPHLKSINFNLHGPEWSPQDIRRLGDVLIQYEDRFSKSKTDLGYCRTCPFKIELKPGTTPVSSRPYRTNPLISGQVDQILDSYLAAGLIQHSTSQWSSPLVVVPKRDGSIRITVNYKRLNAVSIVDKYPLPRIDDLIDTLGSGKVYSTFDLMSGFFQVAIDPSSVEMTAFITPRGLYEWKVMPQGHAGSPGSFVRLMRQVTMGLNSVRMYLDDAIVFDPTPTQHVESIRAFLARLVEHNLKLSPSKAVIGAERVTFLGHSISSAGVRPDPKKVEALNHMPMPSDVSQLRSLLGGLSYYRKFLPDLAKRLRPVTDLLKQRTPFRFTPEMEKLIRDLLRELTEPHVLAYPDWDAAIDGSRPFRLYCDACRDGFGATLEQQQPDGSIRPITFLSRVTLPNERNWTILELEAGAIVWAIKRLRPFFFGIAFIIVSDHQALASLDKVGEHHPRVQRWMEFLNAYQFKLEYRKGSGHNNADFLSRLPVDAIPEDIEGDCRLTHPDDVDVYFVGASGLWPRVVTADSTNSRIPLSDISVPLDHSRPSRFVASISDGHSLPPTPFADDDFCDFRSFHEKPQITAGLDATKSYILPVNSIPLAERISQRTRSRAAASRRSDRPAQSIPSPSTSSRPARASTAGSDPSEATTFSLNRPADAGLETTVGIHTPAAPHVKRAFNAPDSSTGRPPPSGVSSNEFASHSADPDLVSTRPHVRTAPSDEITLDSPRPSIRPDSIPPSTCERSDPPVADVPDSARPPELTTREHPDAAGLAVIVPPAAPPPSTPPKLPDLTPEGVFG